MECYKYWKWSNNYTQCDTPIKSIRKQGLGNDISHNDGTHNDDNKPGNINKLLNFVPFETMVIEPNNKRCENSERISAREMVIQTNINPFLNNNYIEDINVQDTILRPKDSNFKDESINYNQ
jgi:hypothetical protein